MLARVIVSFDDFLNHLTIPPVYVAPYVRVCHICDIQCHTWYSMALLYFHVLVSECINCLSGYANDERLFHREFIGADLSNCASQVGCKPSKNRNSRDGHETKSSYLRVFRNCVGWPNSVFPRCGLHPIPKSFLLTIPVWNQIIEVTT